MTDHCPDCGAAIIPEDDDAGVCIQCGGRNRRRYEAWQCQRCGEAVGWFGRLLGLHECGEKTC